MATKREIILQAFSELGVGGFTFDHSPEELDDAMDVLDAMMDQWAAQNIIFTTPYASGGDLDDETNAPADAVAAMYLNLAMRLAPRFGKAVLPETRGYAATAHRTLLRQFAKNEQISLERTILGAGNKRRLDGPFVQPPADGTT